MKRKAKGSVKVQESSDSEGEEYDEDEEEEEESEEEESLPSKRNKGKKPQFSSSGHEEAEDHSEEDDEDSEKRKLTHEKNKGDRASGISSKKNPLYSNKNFTTNSADPYYGGRRKLSGKELIIKWFKSRWFSCFMLLVTGWTMIGDDFRNLGPKSIDPLFYTLVLLCIMIFCADIGMSIKFTKDYFPSLYLIVDII